MKTLTTFLIVTSIFVTFKAQDTTMRKIDDLLIISNGIEPDYVLTAESLLRMDLNNQKIRMLLLKEKHSILLEMSNAKIKNVQNKSGKT